MAELRASDNSELSRELGKFVAAMENFMPDMKNLSASMKEQSKILERLSTTLAQSIGTFGEKQIERLDAMKISIEQMQNSTAQAEKNSAALLDGTKNYQQQALDNDAAQMKILSDNTAQIVAMKNSFDNFLQNMAKNFSKNFIAALNESIKNLNNQLQTQLGENFKELNSAVREVAAWQREYKEIVIKTTDELKIINETFNRKSLGELKTSMKTFADTSEKNISLQKNLADITAQIEKNISQIQSVMETLSNFSVAASENLTQLTKTFTTEIKTVNKTAAAVALDTKQYLNDFNKTSADSMRIIQDTIGKFKIDLNKETENGLSKLHQLFESVAKNTEKQSDKAIKTLAAALAAVSGQMIENYKSLVAKIAEVDNLLRRQAK